MPIEWSELAGLDRLDGQRVEIEGWIVPFELEARYSYFLLARDMACCLSCRPTDPERCIEVFARSPIAAQAGAVRLAGTWQPLTDDPAGWRYQLRDTVLLEPAPRQAGALSRRAVVALGAALPMGLAGLAQARLPWRRAAAADAGTMDGDAADAGAMKAWLDQRVTVDLHSHAGRILKFGETTSFADVAGDMRRGGMAAACLAVVADSPATHVLPDGRIQAYREPGPDELYYWSQRTFPRLNALIAQEGLTRVERAADLAAARGARPGVIVAAEGADFLGTRLERLEEAYRRYGLRHLQLTHYRVNDLGDIQTEAPVHGGLTDFGAEVIRACNAMGVVVDIAHGTFDLVKRAAATTAKPLVLSHTSLATRPGPRSRQITADHARLVAETGGVIGVWPVKAIFKDIDGYANGFARMVDAAGIDHVGLGSDMRGLTGPSLFDAYADLPRLAAALRARGFDDEELGKLLGGNYLRVFMQSMA